MRKSLKILAIALVIGYGLFLRFACFLDWRENTSNYLFQGDPILTTFDGYYYLRYARDIVEGNYHKIDELRAVPEKPPRPFPPPLLSGVTSGIAWLSGASVEWVATLFPAYAGVLLFFPLFFLSKQWGNSFSGLVAGLVGLCAPYYVRRSSAGWYDTDCGVVTLAMMGVLLSCLMAKKAGRQRVLWLIAAVCNFFVFFMWWDTAPEVTIVICLLPLVSSYLFLIGPRKRDLVPILMVCLAVGLSVTVWKGVSFWNRFVDVAWGIFHYISKGDDPHFPNIGVTISEQVRVSLEGTITLSAGNWFLFLWSILGLALLFIKHSRYAVQLIVPVVLGLLTFYARRFAIFLTPVVALGVGYLFTTLWNITFEKSRKFLWKIVFGLGCAGLLYGIWSVTAINLAAKYNPVEPPRVIEGLSLAREDTPSDSVIWAWWDHGYPIMYWSRRATISDGTFHGGELSVMNAFPLVCSEYRQAANWMHFYVARGLEGFHRVYGRFDSVSKGLEMIRQIMAAGPEKSRHILKQAGLIPEEEWMTFFFPPQETRRPVYLLVDERLVGTSYWWYWLGSWEPEKREGQHPLFQSFSQVKLEGSQLQGLPPFTLNLDEGVLDAGNTRFAVSRVIFHDQKEWKSINYPGTGLVFQYDSTTGWGALCSPDIFESVFNKLFFLRMADVRYFRPTRLKTSSFQLWEVHGDVPEAPVP